MSFWGWRRFLVGRFIGCCDGGCTCTSLLGLPGLLIFKSLGWITALLLFCLLVASGYYQKQDVDKKLTPIRFAQYIWTVQRKPKGNHKLTLCLMPSWEIAISPVHTEAFRNFSASAVGIASLSSWLVANRFSISDTIIRKKGSKPRALDHHIPRPNIAD